MSEELEKDQAQTPPWFMKSVQSHLGLEFDLDVCALPQTAKCEVYYSLSEGNNALESHWAEDFKEIMEDPLASPIAWCNPPFSDINPWIEHAVEQTDFGVDTAMLLPNNPETSYIRKAKRYAEQIIEMPFRMKFLRPDGTPFISEKTGREQSPKFSCLIATFTRYGKINPARYSYHDFREGFYGKV